MVDLKPMTDKEYKKFFPIVIDSYSNELNINMDLDVDSSQKRSLGETNKLLPDGFNTKSHYFFSIYSQNGLNNIGGIWAQIHKKSHLAFIFFLYIKKEYRRQGYGKNAMTQLEIKLREQGINRIQLNVFKKNEAIKLYEEMDYSIVSHTMQKWIMNVKVCNESI